MQPIGTKLNGGETASAPEEIPSEPAPAPGAPGYFSSLYDETYYRSGCGPIPYERTDYWLGFFAGIADQIARSLNPHKVLDAGCAMGFLAESFWARGIEAWGIDISSYAIAQVRRDIVTYCRAASLTEPLTGTYDLVTCIEVLEHIPPEDTAQVIRNLTGVTDTILFSSSPSDFDEPTHVNVRPPFYWLKAFSDCGFQPDMLYDATFLTPHAFLLRRGAPISDEALTLFSRQVFYRCVLAGKDNECRALHQQTSELHQQVETSAARARELEGVHQDAIMLRQQSDSLLNAIRNVEGEREAARAELRQSQRDQQALAGHIAELNEQSQKDQLALAELNNQRLPELREQNASFTEQLLQLTHERNTLDTQLRTVLESPGWKLIQRYRNWLDHSIHRHPWLRKSYEPVVWWFLRRFSGQRSRNALSSAQPDSAAPAVPTSRSVEGAAQVAPLPRPTYQDWIAENELDSAALATQRESARSMAHQPVVSVLLPVYRIPFPILRACVRSVLDQTYPAWELCIAHGDPQGTEHRAFLTALAATDKRVKLVLLDENGGISANSNVALNLASGEFVALLDHDDTLAPFAFYEVACLLAVNAGFDVIYSDHDYIDEKGSRRFNPLFKPDWSPEIMLSANYMTHLTVLRRSAVMAAGGFDPSTDGAQDWDLFFKVTENTTRIGHIPQILYHWRTLASSTALNTAAKDYAQAAQLRSIQAHLDRLHIPSQAEVAPNGLLHLRWLLPLKKRVSIVIPSKDKVHLLSRCIATLRTVTRYDNYEILIVDNGSTEPATHSYYESLRDLPDIRVLPFPHPFNYSAVNNFGARNTTGDLLLFLNNDIEITRPDWLEELAGWMEMPSVGITGARLLLPTGAIQHAGVVVGFDGFAGHPFAGQPPLTFNLFGSTGWYRDYLAVTGACMMMRRDVFDKIGGFDESFVLCGSDVEICLRASHHGYRSVYNPFAELVHYECQTRGTGHVPKHDFLVSYRHYQPYLLDGDPYWSPNLSVWDKNIGCRARGEQSALAFVRDFLRKLDSPAPATAASQSIAVQPSRRPTPSAEATEEDLFVSWFDHTGADLRASQDLMASVHGRLPVRKIVWLIPPFEHAFYGGVYTILRFADGWARSHGVTNHFAVCGSATREQMAERIRHIHPACTAASVTILATPADVDDLPPADACIATLWTTAYYALKFHKAPRKFYFIQDYEPSFYRAGSASALVENTYRFGFYGIANTVSLKEVYEREFGATAAYFSPCVDLSVFHPPVAPLSSTVRTWRLFCYARPQHPRNAFELLAAALRIVKSHLGKNVSILCAGSEWNPADYALDNVVENLGLLTYRQTADLYRSCHAGAVLMLTRHPSYIPLELMASGALVITNRNHWTEWLLRDRENCLLSHTTATCLAETIEEGLTDHALRQRITASAGAMVRERYSKWEDEIARIYEFLCDPQEPGNSP